MSYSQKYCLVSFVDPIEVGSMFEMSDWPLHVTLVDVFAVELNSDLENKTSDLLVKLPPVITHATKEVSLGTAQVVLLDKNDSLLSLHTQIVNLLTTSGAEFNNPDFIRGGFLPHCTIQKAGRINISDEIKINIITLVDMFPSDNWQQRKVLRNFKLGTI